MKLQTSAVGAAPAVLMLSLALTLSCSQPPPPAPPALPPALQAAPAVAPPEAPPAAARAAAEPAAPPAVAPTKAEPAAPPAAKKLAPAPVAEAAPAPAHAALGSDKCKICHKVQYDSWAASKHAKAAQPVGCETCHGNGADYAKMGVMKDRAQSIAAGLIMPTRDFCTAKCHKPAEFKDEMLKLAHAHKQK